MTSKRSLQLVLVAGLLGAVVASSDAPALRLASDTPATPFWQSHGAGILPAPEPSEVEQLRAAARDARMVRVAAAAQ